MNNPSVGKPTTPHEEPVICTIWDYDAQTVTRYLREGDCNCCGICCYRTIQFSFVKSVDPENIRQGGLITFDHGKWIEVGEGENRIFYRMREHQEGESRCVHLGCDNRCDDYEHRFALCRTWPNSPDDLAHIPECSYTFKLLDHLKFSELKP